MFSHPSLSRQLIIFVLLLSALFWLWARCTYRTHSHCWPPQAWRIRNGWVSSFQRFESFSNATSCSVKPLAVSPRRSSIRHSLVFVPSFSSLLPTLGVTHPVSTELSTKVCLLVCIYDYCVFMDKGIEFLCLFIPFFSYQGFFCGISSNLRPLSLSLSLCLSCFFFHFRASNHPQLYRTIGTLCL